MIRLGFVALSSTIFALAGSALAADMPPRVMAPMAAPAPTWTGLYLGGSLGWRGADVDGTTLAFAGGPLPFPQFARASYDSDTFRGGGYLGYNWQVSPSWVVGLEGDAAWGHGRKQLNFLQGVVLPGTGDFSRFGQTWDAGIRGRVGYLITPSMLLYATGGVQWQHVNATVNCGPGTCGIPYLQTNRTTLTGWAIGGGVETMLGRNWLLRAEYRFADFDSWTTTFGPPAFAITKRFDVNTHTAFAGLAYKF